MCPARMRTSASKSLTSVATEHMEAPDQQPDVDPFIGDFINLPGNR